MNHFKDRAPAYIIIRARELAEKMHINDLDNTYDDAADFTGSNSRENEREWIEQDKQAFSHTYKYEE